MQPIAIVNYSTTPLGLPISQPCIYIISYSVEFVKRFSTLFLFFLAIALRTAFLLSRRLPPPAIFYTLFLVEYLPTAKHYRTLFLLSYGKVETLFLFTTYEKVYISGCDCLGFTSLAVSLTATLIYKYIISYLFAFVKHFLLFF